MGTSEPRKMNSISPDAAKALLAPHHADLLACVTEAWTTWREKVRPLLMLARPIPRANLIWDLTIHEARTRFANTPGVRIVDREERFQLVFGERVAVRFKKVGSDLRTSNYPTKTSRRIDAQLGTPGAPARAPLLTIGHQIDPITEELVSVNVVFSIAKSLQWEYQLLDQSGAVIQQLVIPESKRNEPRYRVRPEAAARTTKRTEKKTSRGE